MCGVGVVGGVDLFVEVNSDVWWPQVQMFRLKAGVAQPIEGHQRHRAIRPTTGGNDVDSVFDLTQAT